MMSSGGEDSGIWRSTDGGDTWQSISTNPGLPTGTLGKIGIAASPAKSGRVLRFGRTRRAGGMYRSEDHGDSWKFVGRNKDIISRAWYYMHLTPDPQDADTRLRQQSALLEVHVDAGATYSAIGTPHGDNHDLWIDPQNPPANGAGQRWRAPAFR